MQFLWRRILWFSCIAKCLVARVLHVVVGDLYSLLDSWSMNQSLKSFLEQVESLLGFVTCSILLTLLQYLVSILAYPFSSCLLKYYEFLAHWLHLHHFLHYCGIYTSLFFWLSILRGCRGGKEYSLRSGHHFETNARRRTNRKNTKYLYCLCDEKIETGRE